MTVHGAPTQWQPALLRQQECQPAGGSPGAVPAATPVRAFVGGPIQHAVPAGRFDQDLRLLLETIHEQLRTANFAVLSAHLQERFGESGEDEFSPAAVTMRDFHWMRDCDVYVCVLPLQGPGTVWVSGGTHIELGWASALGIPTVIVWAPEVEVAYSHLVRGLHMIGLVSYLRVGDVLSQPTSLGTAIQDLVLAEPARRSGAHG